MIVSKFGSAFKFQTYVLAMLLPFIATAQEIDENYLKVNGIDMYYRTYGDGPAVILLHGWLQTAAFWNPTALELSRSYKVYVPDLRGHGKTTPLTDDFSIERTANDVEVLINSLELKSVRAIGLSFGSQVLIQAAKSNPGMFSKMILVSCDANFDGKKDNEDNSFDYETLDNNFKEQLLESHISGEDQVRALFNPDLNYNISISPKELQQIKATTLIIAGDTDPIVGLDAAIELKSNLPNANLWVIPGGGHIPITQESNSAFIQSALTLFTND